MNEKYYVYGLIFCVILWILYCSYYEHIDSNIQNFDEKTINDDKNGLSLTYNLKNPTTFTVKITGNNPYVNDASKLTITIGTIGINPTDSTSSTAIFNIPENIQKSRYPLYTTWQFNSGTTYIYGKFGDIFLNPPPPVTNLRVENVTSNSFVAKWDVDPKIVNYAKRQFKGDFGNFINVNGNNEVTVQAFNNLDIKNVGLAKKLTVILFNDGGESEETSIYVTTTFPKIPDPITNLQILLSPTTKDFTVAWDGMYASNYIFRLNEIITVPTTYTYNPSTNYRNSASFRIPEIRTPSTSMIAPSYIFSIIPSNYLGTGSGANIQITPLLNAPRQKPNGPNNFKLNSSSTQSNIMVTWTGGENATQFIFNIKKDGKYFTIVPTTLTSNSASFTNFNPDIINSELEITAKNINGNAKYTQKLTLNIPASPPLPNPITKLRYYFNDNKTTFTVTWEGGASNVNYSYYLDTTLIQPTSVSNNSATFNIPSNILPKTPSTSQSISEGRNLSRTNNSNIVETPHYFYILQSDKASPSIPIYI